MKAGWVEKHLEDIGTIQTGSTPKTSEKENFGDFIPFIKPADFNSDGSLNYENDGLSGLGLTTARRVAAGSVMMVCIGATIGKCGFSDHDVTTNQQINSLTPAIGVSSKFVYYQMLTEDFQRRVILSSAQMTLPIINKSKWGALTIALPASLPEQQHIVRTLDEAFEGIATAKANAEKNLQNARELFESYLEAVFSQRGEGWVEKKLSDVAENISTGPFGTMLHKSDYVPDGIPLVNPMNIVDSRIVPSSKMMVNKETRDRLSGYVLKAGDIVIARRGELGRCALVTEREEGWLCGTGSFFVRLSDWMDGKFFVALFGSPQFKILLESSAVGTTMSSLNHSILNDLPILVPPVEVQRAIMAKADELLSETQRLESLYQRKLAALEALKKSLLHQAFNGEL